MGDTNGGRPVVNTHRASLELGPVVVAGIIRWLSASTIAKGDPLQKGGCLRRWHFKEVEGLTEPGTASQDLGTMVHGELEHFLKTGEKAVGRIASAALRFAAPVREAGQFWVEQSLLTQPETVALAAGQAIRPVLAARGIPVAGHIDLVRKSERYVNTTGEFRGDVPNCAEVNDWKTTKAFTFALTGPGLVDTVQMPLYGEWARRRLRVDNVRLSHVYIRTEGTPEAIKATTVVPAERLVRRWEQIEGVVGSLVDAARVPPGRSNDVDPNPHACRAFNRLCAYAPRCNVNASKTLHDMLGGAAADELLKGESEMTNLLDMFPDEPAAEVDFGAEIAKLAAEEAAAKAAAPAKPAPPPASVAPALPDGFREAVAFLDSVVAEWGFPATTGACAQAIGLARGFEVATGAGLSPTVGKLAKLPPIADPGQFVKLAADLKRRLSPAAAEPAGLLPPDAPASDPAKAAAPIDAPAEAPKTKRGRPAKAPKTETQVVDATDVVPTAMRLAATPKAEPAAEGFTLFVNCVPLSGEFESLDGYVEELCSRLCAKYECVDVRCAPKGTPLEFGQWRGVVAALAKGVPPAPGTYVIHTDNEVKTEIASALATIANGGARGFGR